MSKYDEWEEIYRKYPAESLPWELGKPRPVLVDLIKSKKVIPKGKALDMCCGFGTNTIYLAKAGFVTTGVDISKTAINYARKKSLKAGVDIKFYVGNFLHLPFEGEEFNFVFDMGCFHHVLPEDREKYIRGVRRVLKQGGHYFMVCFSNRNGAAWNHFSREDIITIFSPYFDIMDIDHFSSVEGDGYIRFFYANLMAKTK